MNYYEVYDAKTGDLLAKGTSWECMKKLGCTSNDSFYALVNRSRRGIIKKYTVKIEKGGLSDYPVLGKNDPLYRKEN